MTDAALEAACRAAWSFIGDPVPWDQVHPSRADVFRQAIAAAIKAAQPNRNGITHEDD